MDYINIENLEIFAKHGVLSEEVALGQKFIVCAKLYLELEKAGKSDDLDMTVNYAQVCDFISEYVRNHSFKLIETIAQKLAEEILKKYCIVDKVAITVKKPWAPIGQPLENVWVNIKRGWHDVSLSIGSNMGDKKAYLDAAVKALKEDDNNKNIVVSDYIVTKPYGGVEQDDFLNGAIILKTLYSPHDLLKRINEIEIEHNRTRQIHWGPRTLDIDILLYDDVILSDDKLTIPHIDMCNREFVLKPLAQIAPYKVHPIKKLPVCELMN